MNAVLEEVHDDYVTLRRHLVDEGLFERKAGVYRRPGTTITYRRGLHSAPAGR